MSLIVEDVRVYLGFLVVHSLSPTADKSIMNSLLAKEMQVVSITLVYKGLPDKSCRDQD